MGKLLMDDILITKKYILLFFLTIKRIGAGDKALRTQNKWLIPGEHILQIWNMLSLIIIPRVCIVHHHSYEQISNQEHFF